MSETIKVEIEIPKPPVPFARIELRSVAPGDRFVSLEGGWSIADHASPRVFLVAVPIEPPKSVPGFKAGVTFERHGNGEWKYRVPTREGWHCVAHIPEQLTAGDFLKSLHSDIHEFTTTEDD